MADELCIPVTVDADLVPARAAARRMADELGFSRLEATLIATAVSEIARNIIVHAHRGEIYLRPRQEEYRYGLEVVARDDGPGIPDVEGALRHGQGGGPGLGLGLPGARRLMDEFRITTEQGRGTVVTMQKWRTRNELERLRERRRPRALG